MRTNDKEGLIRTLAEIGFVKWSDEPFTLKSGIKSHFYVSGREELTTRGWALRQLGDYLAWHVAHQVMGERNGTKEVHLIGIPTAGTTLAAAAAIQAPTHDRIGFRMMREKKKAHGANQRWVDGLPNPEEEYLTIDNVITDGGSKIEAFERLREDGYPADTMTHMVLVDRQQGGIESLQGEGYKMLPILKLLEIVHTLIGLEIWPKERLAIVEAEIAAHQFA